MPEPQSRTEFRVVGERPDGSTWHGTGRAREVDWDMRNEVRELSKRNRNVRIQKRTVTETPWEDVPDGE